MSTANNEPVITSYAKAPARTIVAGGITFAYRELGPKGGIPVIFFVHLAATLDNWDPRIIDPIAKHRHVIAFDNRGVGASQIIQWEVPSHPAVGATTLAGSVSGLDELPGDVPLFVGNGRAPYKLFWELRYQEYEAIEGCLPGPNGRGNYNCGGGTGHHGITGYEWRNHSSGGDIPPSAVANLPAGRMADINNDGTPDAYWDINLTLRRMDDAGSISNPQYQHYWNWGGIIYWEGKGRDRSAGQDNDLFITIFPTQAKVCMHRT